MSEHMMRRWLSRVWHLVVATWLAATAALAAKIATFGEWAGLMQWLVPAFLAVCSWRDWLDKRAAT